MIFINVRCLMTIEYHISYPTHQVYSLNFRDYFVMTDRFFLTLYKMNTHVTPINTKTFHDI